MTRRVTGPALRPDGSPLAGFELLFVAALSSAAGVPSSAEAAIAIGADGSLDVELRPGTYDVYLRRVGTAHREKIAHRVPVASGDPLPLLVLLGSEEAGRSAVQEALAALAVPIGGAPGQILAAGADGSRVWVDPPAGTGGVAWDQIGNKPDAFPPADHAHNVATSEAAGFMSAADRIKLAGLSNYQHPATHTIAEVSGLQIALDSKAPAAHGHAGYEAAGASAAALVAANNYTDQTAAPASHAHDYETTGAAAAALASANTYTDQQVGTRAPSEHSHDIGEVAGLRDELDSKAAQTAAPTFDRVGFTVVNKGALGPAATLVLAEGAMQRGLLTEHCTLAVDPLGAAPGTYCLELAEDATGGWGVIWGAGFGVGNWVGSADAHAVNVAPGGRTLVYLRYDGIGLALEAAKVGAG